MTTALQDVVAYICARYPHADELSNARLTKLVYLADWQAVRTGREPLTNIRWKFHNYGPWVSDVFEAARTDSRLLVDSTINAYGSDKRVVRTAAPLDSAELLDDESRRIVDAVIADTESLYFGQFIEYVYDTAPVRGSHRHEVLDLKAFASALEKEDEPIDLRAAFLSPTEYAKVRDAVDMMVASRLVGHGVFGLTAGYSGPVPKTLRFDRVDLDARMPVTRIDSATVEVNARGWTTLSAIVSGSGELTHEYVEAGYFVLRADWAPGEMIIGVRLPVRATVNVEKNGNQHRATIKALEVGPSAA